MDTTHHHAPAYRYQYAGFWMRIWAALIDITLIAMIVVPILLLIYGPGYFDSSQLLMGTTDLLIVGVFPTIAVLWFWFKKQATPGMLAIRAKIVDARTGQPATPTQLAGRYLAYFISAVPCGLGFLWIALNRRKQGWHDFLSGTVVVRKVKTETEPMQFHTSQS
jgi:uncharacterized RDD family membrane protein YckC